MTPLSAGRRWTLPACLRVVARLKLAACLAVTVGLIAAARPAAGQFQLPSTVQLPTFGVSIDADGVLTSRMFAEPGGRVFAERVIEARATRPADLLASSELRKVSLRRLEAAMQQSLAEGDEPDDVMRHLAGLQRVQYAFIDPATRDIIIAGPAEGWIQDASGRSVGMTTGAPVVLLEDLLAALRLFAPDQPADLWVGCTIDPDAEGLRRLAEFQSTIPSRIPERAREAVAFEVAQGMVESLGMANVRLFNLSPRTHMAQVLVEADYRMKLIGMGLEPPPVEMATFISASRTAEHQVLQRWWFTPQYDCIRIADDGLSIELIGQGVQLLSEDYSVGHDGRLERRDQPVSRASRLYTLAFTRKYEEIAGQSPVFGQLRLMIDVLVISAWLHRQDAYQECAWTPELLLDENRLPVELHAAPERAPCVANAVWKGNRLLAPAGGGVSIRPSEALEESNLLPDDKDALPAVRARVSPLPDDDTRWWWD